MRKRGSAALLKSDAMIQYILFTILVVATPFVVVTRYLQGVAHIASHLSIPLAGVKVPIILIFAAVAAVALVIRIRKSLNRRRLTALLVILVMIVIAHRVQDLYLNLSFFDLQMNWHYLAYGAYVFYFFRAHNARKMKKHRMILFSFGSAVIMSAFDETFQFFLSNRTFDISDIAKDSLGAVIGLILVLFVTETYGSMRFRLSDITQKRIADYFRNPASALVVVAVLSFSFILTSPLLSEHEYWLPCVLSGLLLFLFVMSIIHLLQFKPVRRAMAMLALVLVIAQSLSYGLHSRDFITYNRYGLTVYKGIPLPFFDILIYPNGLFRLVDKKHHFRSQDKRFLLRQKPDILLIGSGSQGRGGKGFPTDHGTFFVFNRYTLSGTQVIVLPTPDACREYNRLKREGKNVLFVIHNTC